jgi:hypothetical protein
MRQQLWRPLTGIGLYAISGLVGWFVSSVAGLICIIIMIAYQAHFLGPASGQGRVCGRYAWNLGYRVWSSRPGMIAKDRAGRSHL